MIGDRSRIGIIGAGFISDYHIQGLQAAGGEIVILSSITEESALTKAKPYNIPNATGDYREVLDRQDIDAVLVLTPDFTHRDIAIQAAHAGKAIYLQKPMARNSNECREIIAAAGQAGVPLYVSFMHRYFEEVERTRELLDENILGRIFSVRQRNATAGAKWASWFYKKENVGGGVVMQLGVHGIDLLRYLFGDIVAVRATLAQMKHEVVLADGSVVKPDNEDLALITYRFANGMIGIHEAIYNEVAGTDRFRMEIYGEKGSAWLRTERGLLAIYAPQYLGHSGWFTPDLTSHDPGLRQHNHFLQMLSGKIPSDQSAQDGLISILVTEAIYRSADSGAWVEVEQP